MKYCFGDIVIVDEINIGVVVKSWVGKDFVNHDVYVRMYNGIKNYKEEDMQRYMVRHKYLSDEELEYQQSTISNE